MPMSLNDYYLFRNLKSHLRGMRFRDDGELKAATEAWFEDQIDNFYFKGIRGMFEMNCLLSSSSISTWGTIKTNTCLYRAIQYLHNGV